MRSNSPVSADAQTVAIEPLLRKLRMPTLIVWKLDDIFFGAQSAHWLKKTIPGAERLVEVPGAMAGPVVGHMYMGNACGGTAEA